jgi:hypothetical protein
MLIVRDRRDGRAVSWGTDHERMRQIAARNDSFYAVEDRAASLYYCNLPKLRMGQIHPYDLSAQQEAEIKP